MPSTTYTVNPTGETRSAKGAAIKLAEKHNADTGEAVTVTTQSGTEVFSLAAKGDKRTHVKPGTRTETPNFEVTIPEGYEPAYVRNRIKTVVLRATEGDGYRVVQVDAAGNVVLSEVAADTTEARAITNRLAKEHAEAKVAAEAQAKLDKAAAKQAKADAKATAETEVVAA